MPSANINKKSPHPQKGMQGRQKAALPLCFITTLRSVTSSAVIQLRRKITVATVVPTFRDHPCSAHSLQKEFGASTHDRLAPIDGSLNAFFTLLIFAQAPLEYDSIIPLFKSFVKGF